MSVGERIVELRKASSLSQGQLAERMGVSRQAVSKWENDLSTPEPLRLIQLADVLNTDTEFLASGQHSHLPASPIIIRQVEEKPVYVEKVVEKPIYVQKPPDAVPPKIITKEVPVERVVERVVEKPVVKVKKVVRVQYRSNPFSLILAAAAGLVLGIVIGFLL